MMREEGQFEKGKCKECGKDTECRHQFTFPDGKIMTNHCLKCMAGHGGDPCKMMCPQCFQLKELKEKEDLNKFLEENDMLR